jgi:hypothetical protein
MINKYFGDQVQASFGPAWKNPNDIQSTFSKLSKAMDNGAQVVIGTYLTGPGHVVLLNDVVNTVNNVVGGIDITDPYGNPMGTGPIGNNDYTWKNNANMNYTIGENTFINWDYVQSKSIGKDWTLLITTK